MKKYFRIPMILWLLIVFPVVLSSSPLTHEIMKKFITCNFYNEHSLFDGRFVLTFKENIQLSAIQGKKIEKKMILFEESMISRCAEIKIQELHLASYIRSEKIDRNEVKKLIREINKNKTTLSIAYLNYLLDIKSILTPTQIDKLKQIKNRLRQKKRNEIRQHRENEIHPGVMDPDHT